MITFGQEDVQSKVCFVIEILLCLSCN